MEKPRYWIYHCRFQEKNWLGLISQDQWSQNLTRCIIYFALDLKYVLRITNVNRNAEINWSALYNNTWWKHAFYTIGEDCTNLFQKGSCALQGAIFSTKSGQEFNDAELISMYSYVKSLDSFSPLKCISRHVCTWLYKSFMSNEKFCSF